MTLSWLLGIAGLLLGRARPSLGLGVLVGVVVVTPSIDWQLGLANRSTAFVYLFGLLVGALWHRIDVASPESRSADAGGLSRRIALAIRLSILTIAVSSLLALLRNVQLSELGFQLRAAFAELGTFNPQAPAGPLQAALIATMGLLLLALFVERLDNAARRSMLSNAFTVGIAVAVCSPLLQLAFLNPFVRPDKRVQTGEGLVGFFQDEHSFAAFLLLAIGVSAGRAYGSFHAGRRAAAWAHGGLMLASFLVLLQTNSRGGLLALAGAVLVTALAWLALSLRTVSTSKHGRRMLVASSVVSVLLVAVPVGLVVSSSLRGSVQRTLGGFGNPRMWEFLDPATAENPLLARRVLLWSKASDLIAERPIWGFGPKGFPSSGAVVAPEVLVEYGDIYGTSELAYALEELEVENAHSYFLQYAAEFGVPAAVALMAVLAMVLATILRAAVRCPDGPERGLLAGIAFGQVAFLTLSLVSHPLLLAELQGAFWALTALGLATAAALRTPDD